MKRLLILILVLSLAIILPCYADNLLHGRTVYEKNCASCHGEFGKGDGPKAETLDPRPINLTVPAVMENIPPERIEKAVVQGIPGVAGHTFGHLLTHDEVRDVIVYVKSLVR